MILTPVSLEKGDLFEGQIKTWLLFQAFLFITHQFGLD